MKNLQEVARTRFGEDFQSLLDWYLENGFVYSGKELFVLACMHNKDAVLKRKVEIELDKVDCWYVQYAVGDLKRLFEIMPEHKEFVVFEREGINRKPKVYRTDQLQRRLCYGKGRLTTTTKTTTTTCNGS